MDKHNKISVIVPVYNCESSIAKTLESILNQTFKNIEILIINDGSTDGSIELCRNYQKTNKNIRIINQENHGLAFARYVGIHNASSDLIGFVDGDDWIKPNMFERLFNNIKSAGADISVCETIRVFDKLTIDRGKTGKIFEADTNKALKIIMKDKKYKSYFNNKLIKRDILMDIDVPPVNVLTDFYIMHKIFARAKKVVFEDSGYYYYKETDNSISGGRDIKQYMTICEVHWARYNSKEALPFKSILKKNFLNDVAIHAKMYMYNKNISSNTRKNFNSFINSQLDLYFKNQICVPWTFLHYIFTKKCTFFYFIKNRFRYSDTVLTKFIIKIHKQYKK